jgi:selenocysteine-specific elongation factor
MPVIGTAGHVDHGKSTLILALTGRDPDRWDEEKRRGLTIDLGFAWTSLPGGSEVSFVDVPGHERFIKNMLAGVEAIDVALFVVAADEGWKAQSEEHLAVLDLLEVRHGVVALTKVDRVDDDTADLVRMDIEERLIGTTLAGSPIVAVSATTGEGLEPLRTVLAAAARAANPRPNGRPRLWIDRSFSIAGTGTVVTGTLLGSALEVGMTVDVWPAEGGVGANAARIRSLESHETRMERVEPFRRVAASLVGVEREQTSRGSMLGMPGEWQPTRRFLATLRHPRHIDGIGPRNALQLHIGSGAWPVRARQLSERALLCELRTELCLQVGDRFILRDTGRRAVVAGGQVLDPAPATRGEAIRQSADELTRALETGPDHIADALLSVRKSASPNSLRAHSGGGQPLHAVMVGELLLHEDEARRLTSSLVDLVRSFHQANPMRPGAPGTFLANRLGVGPAVVEALARTEPQLSVEHGLVSHRERAEAADPTSAPQWHRARQLLEADGLAVPRIGELGLDPELFHALVRAGALIKISDELAYLPDQVRTLLSVLASMPPEFTVSDFREAAAITRKYAVPFLEWTDLQGKTLRRADTRTVRDTSL